MASLAELILKLSPAQQQRIARYVASMPKSAGGLDMPMSNTSAQRANALGYTTSAFRGTTADELAARAKQFVSESPEIASQYAGYVPSHEEFNIPMEAMIDLAPGGNVMPLLVKDAKSAKSKTLVPSYEMVSGAPNIRSRFAAFNPWLKGSANLLASHPAATLMASGGLSGLVRQYLNRPFDPTNQYSQYGMKAPYSVGDVSLQALGVVPYVGNAATLVDMLRQYK